MGRAITRENSCSSSSNSSNFQKKDFSMDLRLGLNISTSHYHSNFPSSPMDDQSSEYWQRRSGLEEGNDYNNPALFVKVYMEGIPIGRKMNLLAHDGYHSLIRALDYMFNATILWADVEIVHSERFHVLTYEDKEGDWLIVGDVPWEMFVTSVRRLKITRADRF